jgi:hypothetical protein
VGLAARHIGLTGTAAHGIAQNAVSSPARVITGAKQP